MISNSRNRQFRLSAMAKRGSTRTFFFFLVLISFLAFAVNLPALTPLPSLVSASHHYRHFDFNKGDGKKFEIADDIFWKDGEPFRIIGGDLHYFRIVPEYWEDRLLRAKALGLNTIQTYVPWNLHEPKPGKFVFDGIADIVSFLELCQRLNLLVMLRAGPYICAEWDLGGFPSWLLAKKPPLRLRSSDLVYLQLVDQWWGIILPKIAPLLYASGGPIIMVQVENEFGSYGDDQAYLLHLVSLARSHLGNDIILYTTDGGSRDLLNKGTIREEAVYSAVDFTTGDDPWPIFKLQKEFNAPGKSPPLSSEFYTGWLTHWGEKIASTDANYTAAALKNILAGNGSAVLYMAHGGTNFGFYNGANTGLTEFEFKPDLTSYDYDAPIRESGDIDNDKFHAIRTVIEQYAGASLPSIPADNAKIGYGSIHLQRTSFLFDVLDTIDSVDVVKSKNPESMESLGQEFGFILYVSEYVSKEESTLSVPRVHDRAQVFVLCSSEDSSVRPTHVGTIERWSKSSLSLPYVKCVSNVRLYLLVENMGRVNYGPHIFDEKGILSSVYLNNKTLHKWRMLSISFDHIIEMLRLNPIFPNPDSESTSVEPAFYTGQFFVDNEGSRKDTYLSLRGWSKGIAFVNNFNLGRFWPSVGPQCNLYVPAPILQTGVNRVVVLELESPNPELVVDSVDGADFTCGTANASLRRRDEDSNQFV